MPSERQEAVALASGMFCCPVMCPRCCLQVAGSAGRFSPFALHEGFHSFWIRRVLEQCDSNVG